MKRVKVANLAGRVIESVTIFSAGDAEDALSIEIRCAGGAYFRAKL